MGPAVFSVFTKDGRLAATVLAAPGRFRFARAPDEAEPLPVPFATVACCLPEAEPVLLSALRGASDLDGYWAALSRRRFRVIPGLPRPAAIARL